MSGVAWTDPPVRDRRGGRRDSGRWDAVADELRANRSQWGCIEKASKNPTVVGRIRDGKGAFAPAGTFEAYSKSAGKDEDGRKLYDIWARYVGLPPVTAAEPAQFEQPGGAW